MKPTETVRPKNRKERHGMYGTPEYQAWIHIRQRCLNPKIKEYKDYGGRGITVCESWSFFSNFYAESGPRPGPGYTLDRIDVNGNYEPGNIRWATRQMQADNTRVAKFITYNGMTLTQAAWEREKGHPAGTISRRLSSGWTDADAIEIPRVQGQKHERKYHVAQ